MKNSLNLRSRNFSEKNENYVICACVQMFCSRKNPDADREARQHCNW